MSPIQTKTVSHVPLHRLASMLAALLLAPLTALADGAIAGTVKDAERGDLLQGASVRIMPGGLETVTDRTGEFFFPRISAGSYTLEASYLGRATKTSTVTVVDGKTARVDTAVGESAVVMEAFHVESIREGQARAINQQLTSATIKNIISADAIGNLPDRTVGEALGRLPGVNVVDDSFASVRGTPAKHNSVTLDGERLTTSGNDLYTTSTTDDTRAVDLSLIPSELVGGIEVTKALTADMDVDSFGGTINLVTRSAFELKQRSVNGKAEYLHNSFRHKPGWAGSLTYMDVLNAARTFGVSATLTYRQEERNTNSYEFAYYDAGAIPVGTSGSGTAAGIPAVGDQGLEEMDTRLNYKDTQKLGAVLNFDWKLSDKTELHWRTFYERTEEDAGRFRTRIRALSRWNASSTAQLQSGQQARLVNLHEDGSGDQHALRLGLDGETQLANGSLKYGVKYGDSRQTASRDRYIFDMPGSTERRRYSWTIDRRDPVLPIATVTHIATGQNGLLADLSDRRLSSIRLHSGDDDARDLTANLDYSFNQTLGERRIAWKFGAKDRSKDRKARPSVRDFAPPAGAEPLYSNFSVVFEPRNLLEGNQPTMGPYVSLREVMEYFNRNRSTFAAASGSEIVRVEARKYDVSEDILAGYGMASTRLNKLEAIAGLRWEQTKTSYHWLADPTGPSRGGNRYDDLYPSLLFNYRFNRNFVARLAYTRTLSRPNYGDLVPYRVLSDTQSESGIGGLAPDDYPETNKVFLGNSKLKAQQSGNYDLSLEYYIPPAGVISVGLFRKDLKDVIFRSQWKDAADPLTLYFQERNGSSGKVEGVEISWQQALTFLPGLLGNLGVNINATFIEGSSVLEELQPGTTSTFRPLRVDFLPEQPEKVFNTQVWWEKYGFTARVAVNHVSEFVRTSGGRTSFSINNDATRWDASLAYRINRNFTVYVEGKNLTEEATRWYATTPNRPEDYAFAGAAYSGGIKFRF